jgi:hypothetical protein
LARVHIRDDVLDAVDTEDLKETEQRQDLVVREVDLPGNGRDNVDQEGDRSKVVHRVLVAIGNFLTRLRVDVRRSQPDKDVHDEQEGNEGVKRGIERQAQVIRVEAQLYGDGHRLVDGKDDDEEVPVQLLGRLRFDECLRERHIDEFELTSRLLLDSAQVVNVLLGFGRTLRVVVGVVIVNEVVGELAAVLRLIIAEVLFRIKYSAADLAGAARSRSFLAVFAFFTSASVWLERNPAHFEYVSPLVALAAVLAADFLGRILKDVVIPACLPALTDVFQQLAVYLHRLSVSTLRATFMQLEHSRLSCAHG